MGMTQERVPVMPLEQAIQIAEDRIKMARNMELFLESVGDFTVTLEDPGVVTINWASGNENRVAMGPTFAIAFATAWVFWQIDDKQLNGGT